MTQVVLETLELYTPQRSCQVHIGWDFLNTWAQALRPTGHDPHLVLMGDQRLRTIGDSLVETLKQGGWRVSEYWFEVSEALKDISQLSTFYSFLAAVETHRRSYILALGGGVVGDVVGFVAATYMRGLRWINIPSTLLAQVDSGIGGKTGMNHPRGKNLIGAFHQPEQVLCDLKLLETLPWRERISGLGEMLKYGLIFDASFYHLVYSQQQQLLALSPELLQQAVQRCVQLKLEIIRQDERDLSGIREVLNFGHTLGHTLEALSAYSYYRHGEAVILGMWAALEISWRAGYLAPATARQIQAELEALPLPPIPAGIQVHDLLQQLKWDKKAEGEYLRWILLKAMGQALVVPALPIPLVATALGSLLERFQAQPRPANG